jgi:hypothetical protein
MASVLAAPCRFISQPHIVNAALYLYTARPACLSINPVNGMKADLLEMAHSLVRGPTSIYFAWVLFGCIWPLLQGIFVSVGYWQSAVLSQI